MSKREPKYSKGDIVRDIYLKREFEIDEAIFSYSGTFTGAYVLLDYFNNGKWISGVLENHLELICKNVMESTTSSQTKKDTKIRALQAIIDRCQKEIEAESSKKPLK